jgi:hypothetical protein
MRLGLLAAALLPLSAGGLPPGDPHSIALLGSRLFVGTDAGLFRWGEGGFEPLLTRAPVRDLSAGIDTLLVATDAGLYEWRRDEIRAHPIPADPEIHAVAFLPDESAWAATGGGLFLRPPGASEFQPVDDFSSAEVRAVRVAGDAVWAATRGALWLRRDSGRFVAVRRGIPEGWWELLDAVPRGAETLLAVPLGLWKFDGAELEPVDPGVGSLRALCAHPDGLWVAADRGVFPLEIGDGAAARVRPGAPGLPVDAFDLTAGEGGLIVAARQGLLRLPRAGVLSAPPPRGFRGTPSDPRVVTLQRAVLAYLGLSPSRLRALERRARSAGLWPRLQASLTADRDRARSVENDQTVSSSRLWSLRDSDRERDAALRLQLEFSWDLARLVSPSDALAVSRERREVVELVERILDRVTRVYFERERVLARLGSLPRGQPEREALGLQARELTATLDGLTGGAFSRLQTDPGRMPP